MELKKVIQLSLISGFHFFLSSKANSCQETTSVRYAAILLLFKSMRVMKGGFFYRSTGHNINSPNINASQINCSIHQRKMVDV
jgi:hypothetical protein